MLGDRAGSEHPAALSRVQATHGGGSLGGYQGQPSQDPELFEEYRKEYLTERAGEYGGCKRRRARDGASPVWKEWASESGGAMACLEIQVDIVEENYHRDEFACGDVNDIDLPAVMVETARAEEMWHMKGTLFQVVKKFEAWARTGTPPISTKWADTDKTPGTEAPRAWTTKTGVISSALHLRWNS